MIGDLTMIIFWWFLLFVLGFSFLPLTLFLFRKFFDRGYAFAKIIALLLVSYSIWLLGSLKILPFFTETIWLVIIAAAVGNIFLLSKKRQEFKKIFQKHWKIFFFEEFLFFLCLTFWSFIRGFQPNIQGLEKFMDYGFVNTILRSKYFPPADMWFAGKTTNYYYFGHLITAVLSKLSGIDSAITYNLMIATIFALCFTAAFSLGGNLIFRAIRNTQHTTRKKIGHWSLGIGHSLEIRNLKLEIFAGLLTAFLLTLGGNLHPLYWFVTHGNFKTYWYPDATRFIVPQFGAADNTIHEFPIYSFVVADLHGHLLNLPLVLLFISLLFSLVIGHWSLIRNWKLEIRNLILPSLILAVFYMTNAWDYPIYLLVTGGAILVFQNLRTTRHAEFSSASKKIPKQVRNDTKYLKSIFDKWEKAFIQTGIICGFLVVGSLLLSLPFLLHFKSIAKGIALTDFHSPPWMLLILWGFPLMTTAIFLIFLLIRKRIASHVLPITDIFILVLLVVSWLLIFIPEIFYVKDIYVHSHQRANTVFKLTYQAFVMFSLASGYIVIRISNAIKRKFLKFLYLIFHLSFLIFNFVYPYFAIRSFYGLKTYQGLYGLNYLKNLYLDDYQAILWLKKYTPGQPVIVEAVGESYTDFARVSANTGLPAILGWRVHEWLWRGSFDEPARRTEEVKIIYESPDLTKTKELLNKYQVWFIFVGDLERKQYPDLQEKKFDQLGEVIFSSGKTKIYLYRGVAFFKGATP